MSKSFTFYSQLDEMDCGATCLRMVARYHGKFYSLERLRQHTFMDRQGVSLLGISDAAEAIGLKTLALQASLKQLQEDIPLPCIVHWQQNHFVVVSDISSKYVKVADPAAGEYKLSHRDFLSNWASDLEDEQPVGIVLALEPTPEFESRDEERVDKSGFKHIFSLLGKYRSLILQLIAGLLVGSIVQLLIPFFLKSLVDVGIGRVDLNFVKLIILGQLLLFVMQLAVDSFRRWIILNIGTRINISLVTDFLTKLTQLPIRFFDSKMTGDMMQRMADHERVQRFMTSTGLVSIFSLFNFVIFLFILFFWNRGVFLTFLIGTSLHLAWVLMSQKQRRTLDYKRFDQASENQTKVVELINGMQEIKLYNAEKQKRWAWERVQSKLYRTTVKSLTLEQWQQAGSKFINESKNLVITFIVIMAVMNNQMTLGMFVAIQYILAQLNEPLNQIVDFVSSMQEAKISLERMDEIHSQANEEKPGEKISILPEAGGLKFDKVFFQYNGPQSPMVLKDIRIAIPKGKTTAIVGASGSGKTTILKLLLNIYQPTSGMVSVGGVNLKNLNQKIWRDLCGIVMQDGYIFNDTIANNIALGDEYIDKAKLLKAVKVANIQSDIERLPLGYNTKIGQEGLGLSKGQQQRLLIARVVYKNPDYIFFDESTSSLDAYNELMVMDELEHFFRGKTVVVVAHRLSTVVNADNIIVMDNGEVVEEGTHEQLTAIRGAYYHLIKNQLELGS